MAPGNVGVDPIMTSSHIITLFTAPPPTGGGLSSFVVSMMVHSTALGMVSVGLGHRTHIVEDRHIKERFALRLLEVHSAQSQTRSSAGNGVLYPGPRPLTSAALSSGTPAASPSAAPHLAQLIKAPRTLVQPDLPPDVLLPPDTPIPAALLWSPGISQSKKVNPPRQPLATTPDVTPSLDPPNHESNVTDLRIASTPFATAAPAPPPGTTSPLVISGHEPVQRVPEMASSPSGPPTPARVMSISDLQMPDGIIALPPANQTAPAASSGVLVTGHGAGGTQNGVGGADKGDKDTGKVAGNKEGKGTATIASIAKNNPNTGANQASVAVSGNGSLVDRINLPKDGRFGVVVVGSSQAEAYPETIGLWGGRLAYTVYVHAGLARNWILQYSVPGAADAAAAGDVVRPDAPWAFYIEVPHVAPAEVNADAILVHGFVNTTGCFEQLAVVSPQELAQKEFVLDTLRTWKFRPAMQNGQVITVEVLLIIPEDQD